MYIKAEWDDCDARVFRDHPSSPSIPHREQTMRDLLAQGSIRSHKRVCLYYLSIRDENGIGNMCPTSPLVNAEAFHVFYIRNYYYIAIMLHTYIHIIYIYVNGVFVYVCI